MIVVGFILGTTVGCFLYLWGREAKVPPTSITTQERIVELERWYDAEYD